MAILADRYAAMAATELDVEARDARHADLVERAREEGRERAAEGDVAHARRDAARDAHHILLGYETLDETLGELFLQTTPQGITR